MNRSVHFNFIEEKLDFLARRIDMRGRLNILDFHIHAEIFYRDFLNLLFDWNLVKTEHNNEAGIDLIDKSKRIVVQVSATASKQKIESALSKELGIYSDYSFKFISISKDAGKLRDKTYSNPHQLIFSPSEDIYDVSSLLKLIQELKIEKQKELKFFLEKELQSEPDPEKVESNLATIISILSKEDWNKEKFNPDSVAYDPEVKISYIDLNTARFLIEDHKIHYFRIDSIYSDFDQQGVNKSFSVLNVIRSEYLALAGKNTPDDCFFNVIEKVIKRVLSASNYSTIAIEELELCVQLLVVDAFIRCKIFKKPVEDSHVDP